MPGPCRHLWRARSEGAKGKMGFQGDVRGGSRGQRDAVSKRNNHHNAHTEPAKSNCSRVNSDKSRPGQQPTVHEAAATTAAGEARGWLLAASAPSLSPPLSFSLTRGRDELIVGRRQRNIGYPGLVTLRPDMWRGGGAGGYASPSSHPKCVATAGTKQRERKAASSQNSCQKRARPGR